MSIAGPSLDRAAQRQVLRAFGRALGQEAHNLQRRPETTWQQLYNRLQFADEPLPTLLAPEIERRSHPGSRPWLRALTPSPESSQLIRVLIDEDRVGGVAFSPDGTLLATGSGDGTVRLWDSASGAVLAVLRGHTGAVGAVAFSSDGRRLASASGDLTVRLWDPASGAERAVLRGHTASVLAVAFSPDGTRLATASADWTVRLWDTGNGAELTTLRDHRTIIGDVAFSPDGAYLTTIAIDNSVRLWDARSGAALDVLPGRDIGGTAIAFSPDGTRLASAGVRRWRLWDVASRDEMAVVESHADWVLAVAFSPDGSRLASAGSTPDPTVRLWDTTTGAELAVLRGHTGTVWAVAFSSDGRRLASASEDLTARVWDVARSGWPDGRTGHTDGGDRHDPGERRSDGAPPVIAPVHSTAWIANVPSGSELASRAGNWPTVERTTVNAVAFSPDGARLADAQSDWNVRLWDVTSGTELAVLRGHTDAVHAVAFSPDGSRLASASNDRTVKVWDVVSGRELAVLQSKANLTGAAAWRPDVTMAWSPDGIYLASILEYSTAQVWDAVSGNAVATVVLRGSLTAVAFHAAQPRLVVGNIAGECWIGEMLPSPYGPLIVTAVDRGGGPAIRCPACEQVRPVTSEWLNQVIACPTTDCGRRLRLNPFVTTLDRRPFVPAPGTHPDEDSLSARSPAPPASDVEQGSRSRAALPWWRKLFTRRPTPPPEP